jgi:hypothetical protein
VYLLYLDESGNHVGSPAFVLGGLAIHERDAWHLQNRLDAVMAAQLPAGLNPLNFEFHASDLKGPRPPEPGRRPSEWLQIPPPTRFGILHAGYHAVATHNPLDAARPIALFGAVVTNAYEDRDVRAYEEVLNRFDEMLTRQGYQSGHHEMGIVIHDRAVLERDVQLQTDTWRHVAGRIGRLTHLADVPLFADSRATRLIQASDLVSWSLWRYYGLPLPDARWVTPLWRHFDSHGGVMHGLAHVSRTFHVCPCPPCRSRRQAAPAAAALAPPGQS